MGCLQLPLMNEVLRRGAAEKEGDYEPLNTTDAEIAAFVKGLEGDLFSALRKLGQDDVRSQTAGNVIEVVVGKGIIKDPSRSADKGNAESGERPQQENPVKNINRLLFSFSLRSG